MECISFKKDEVKSYINVKGINFPRFLEESNRSLRLPKIDEENFLRSIDGTNNENVDITLEHLTTNTKSRVADDIILCDKLSRSICNGNVDGPHNNKQTEKRVSDYIQQLLHWKALGGNVDLSTTNLLLSYPNSDDIIIDNKSGNSTSIVDNLSNSNHSQISVNSCTNNDDFYIRLMDISDQEKRNIDSSLIASNLRKSNPSDLSSYKCTKNDDLCQQSEDFISDKDECDADYNNNPTKKCVSTSHDLESCQSNIKSNELV